MTYDSWKTTDPDDEFRGKHPDEEKADEEFYAEFYANVHTWQDENFRTWHACYGDYDLDCDVGHGTTEREAIDDLADQMGVEL